MAHRGSIGGACTGALNRHSDSPSGVQQQAQGAGLAVQQRHLCNVDCVSWHRDTTAGPHAAHCTTTDPTAAHHRALMWRLAPYLPPAQVI